MYRIAVTGGIACGKSTVGSMLGRRGYPVFECDAAAHELMLPGSEMHRRVIEAFGPVVSDHSGAIDRAVLGRIVFADHEARSRLNSIVHPAVRERMLLWLDGACGAEMAVAVVPLLYEAGWEGGWDAVACVAAGVTEQRTRLEARCIAADEIDARIGAQFPTAQKMIRADYVLYNSGTMELLSEQVDRMCNSILETGNARQS